MNRPIKGDSFRRGQFAHAMFQATANDIPDMRIKIAEGSFWVNNKSLIEFSGGQSPSLEAPATGAKWVLVAINKLGKVVLYNGLALPNNPEAPKVDKNVLPIAFVFVKSSTKVITNDMIYDLRQVFNFSYENEKGCTYKCGLENDYAFTKEDREQLKKYYDKLEDLSLEIDKIRLMFSPQKEYTILTDSGLEYVIRFKDDGTPYFKRKDSLFRCCIIIDCIKNFSYHLLCN